MATHEGSSPAPGRTTRGTRVQRPAPQPDPQVQTDNGGELYEVLVEDPAGHRTVHRVRAESRTEAEKALTDSDSEVLGAAVAGTGLGSG